VSKPIGLVLYTGPSRLDGAPIVVVATLASKNVKTGNMVQTWILRADADPLAASRAATDESVCGDCPHRRSLGGACYVNLGQAPVAVWRSWRAGRYAVATPALVAEHLAGRTVRLGAYGDPAAVPAAVWESLVAAAAGHTGYTHQWRRAGADAYRGLVMASCDTAAEHAEAARAGWRTFTVLGTDDAPPMRTFECLADAKGKSCAECLACDGATVGRDVQAASVWIRVHGALAGRFDGAMSASPSTGRRSDALRVLAA
jgi:hypothetical protein